MNEHPLTILANTDDDFLGMELQALGTDFPVDLLERDVELWKLPDIQIYADPRIKGVRTQRKHKKRKITGNLEQKFHHIPRILKSDIRRQYAVMFSNVYNSGDCSFMRSFCSIFGRCDTSLSILKREITESRESHIGFDACTALWEMAMTEAPDLVFKLNSNQLKLRSDGTSVVSANFTLTGTKFFNFDDSELHHLQILVSKSFSQFQTISSSGSLASPSSSPSSFECQQEGMQIPENGSASLSSSSIYGNARISVSDLDDLSTLSSRFEENPVGLRSLSELVMRLEIERNQKDINVESLRILTVPIAFEFDGQIVIHLDTDSKIHQIFMEVGLLSK